MLTIFQRMSNPRANLELADQLHSAAIHLLRRLRVQDVASGIGPSQLSALSVLVFGGPMSLHALAAAEQVKAPTMSRLVSAMRMRDLVSVEQAAEDARAVVIRVTGEGQKLLLAGRKRRVDSLAKVLSAFSKQDAAALRRASELLQQVVRKL
jgi:DNA-binding MarR family transcriptional regulator